MTARDLARFGLLMQNRGQWQGLQLIPRTWMDATLSTDTKEGSIANYQYGWWLMPGDPVAIRAEGILGQFLYINPTHRIVVVRFGTSLGQLDWDGWKDFLTKMANLVATISNQATNVRGR